MSMISNLVDRLRAESKSMGKYGVDYMATLLMEASDTIIMLSEKARADRPKGKWKDYGTCVMDIGDVQELVCSECGATTFWADYYPLPVMPRYCHNCGARFEVAVDMAKGEEYRF